MIFAKFLFFLDQKNLVLSALGNSLTLSEVIYFPIQ